MSDVKGYKALTAEDITNLNTFKALEAELLAKLKEMITTANMDKRWSSIARTHFEEGFMAACRAVAKPETVEF